MRLDNSKRRQILNKIVASVFDPKKAVMDKEELELCRAVRERIIPQDQLRHIDALPLDWFPHTNRFFIVVVEDDPESVTRLRIPNDLRIPGFLSTDYCNSGQVNTLPTKNNTRLSAQLLKHRDAVVAYSKDREALKAQTEGVLYAMNTAEKLIKHMPEVERLMGAAFFKEVVAQNLPVSTFNTINDQIKASLKAAA